MFVGLGVDKPFIPRSVRKVSLINIFLGPEVDALVSFVDNYIHLDLKVSYITTNEGGEVCTEMLCREKILFSELQ